MGAVARPVAAAAEQLDQLGVHDLHDLLGRRQRRQHVLPDRLFLDAIDEGADDLEVDVGLQERHAHLAERLLDVVLGQAAAPPSLSKMVCSLGTQGIQHGNALLYGNIHANFNREGGGLGTTGCRSDELHRRSAPLIQATLTWSSTHRSG
jgi:hypothetical protein